MGVVTLAMGSLALFLGFLATIKETEGFARAQEGFKHSFDRLVRAAEPFAQKLTVFVGLFDALVSVLVPVFDTFAQGAMILRLARNCEWSG